MKDQIYLYTEREQFDVAPELYGLFFEDINRAADGGLYPEMIRNRAFEDSLVPEGCTADEKHMIYWNDGGWPGVFNHGEGMDEWAAAVPYTEIPGWYAQDAQMEQLLKGTLNSNRKAALAVDYKADGKIINIGFGGMAVVRGEHYLLTVFLKAKDSCLLHISLENSCGIKLGETTVAIEQSEDYVKYTSELLSEDTDYRARISFSCSRENRLIFGFVSLMPEKTFCGHGLREDLALALKNTHSGFIRFPGGCVVEGINEENSFRFSRTIGPVWERPSVQTMWHYRTTNGLGFHEYLQLCEDLEMEALYVCNCGMYCQARKGKGFSEELTEEYLQEALHALEYALGSETTIYGARRAAAGHPKPFRLKYVEIGNENFGQEYLERYRLFYNTLKAAYPDVIYIANVHTEREGLPTEIVDEHYYNAPEFFLESAGMYDDYDRSGPRIFAGEYAVNGGHTIASMECALAEAVYLINVERNQDLVQLTAYAPLFQNADYTAWKPNLIVFNNHEVYGIPSYHAISLLAKHRGKKVVELENRSENCPPVYCGIPGIMCEKEGLLFRNVKINGKAVEISKQIYGDVQKLEDGYCMIHSDNHHHYTGKSAEWNAAFEEFMKNSPFREQDLIWSVFSEEKSECCTFEAEVKAEQDNPVTFSIWNDHPETDAGCNEPRDMEWTLRSVRNQVWKIENGKSMCRVPRMFEKPLKEEEIVPIELDYGVFNHFKIVCDHYGYSCYINDVLIHEKKHLLHPVISACALTDGDEIILKMVNIDRKERVIEITADCELEAEMTTEMLAGTPETVNSFEEPDRIAVRETGVRAELSEDKNAFLYVMPAHSIHVLRMKKRNRRK